MDRLNDYLRQLIEMGEREIVLEWGAQERREPEPSGSGVAGHTGQGVPNANAETEVTGRQKPLAETPVPRGISVEAPPSSSDLFTSDPIANAADLAAIAALVAECHKCGLAHSRTNVVPGEGNPNAGFVVVGEAPGATEDETGRPFVGRAGQLLNDILKAIGFAREDVFIMNVLKCRPPNNRDPDPLEVAACSPFLHRQLALIKPRVILAMGRPAAATLLGSTSSLGDMRQKIHSYRGIPLIVTYHPAALLRNPNWKRPTWDDVRLARRIFDEGSAVAAV
jgi:uracil-DNA glycosylase